VREDGKMYEFMNGWVEREEEDRLINGKNDGKKGRERGCLGGMKAGKERKKRRKNKQKK
jgi:hypothetical protein